MKRLYVGGLSHSVTDKDLKDRFGKFGKVEDVELKTRTDDEGVPFKTFGYINITISDADLKKCLSVLNRSQWKGGTLQIETAKQSFLQRLSEEREEAVQRSLNPPKASSQQQLLDSMRDAGVSNFTMKSAVPGTEIPGHKDWVVAKFGRVLPVLQLNCRRGDKARTMKYDPSKYGHNLRVLAPPPGPEATPTPVSQLTWQVEGGDDDISRKRRGEFPPFTPPPKKRRDRPASDPIGHCNGSSRQIRSLRPPLDNESDEELRHIVQSSHDTLGPEDDTLEVVSTNFSHTRKKDDDERDSADTDELISSRKLQTTQHKMAPVKKRKKRDAKPSNYDSTDEEAEEDSGKKTPRKVKKSAVKNVGLKRDKAEKEADLKEEAKEKTDETDSESDYEYTALFSHAPRLEMSLSDLQALAERFAPEALSTTPKTLSEDVCAARTPKRGTTPEEILASLLEGGSSEEEEERGKKRKQKRKSEGGGAAPPAFRGTKELDNQSEQEKKTKMEETLNGTSSEEDEASASEEESSSEEEPGAVAQRGPASSSDQDTDDEEEEEDAVSPPITDQEEAGHPPVANQKRRTAQEEAELQRRANERRLAAVLQRQKEAEQNRRLIQGALSTTDGAPGGPGGKHIVFSSDDEDDKEEPKQTEPSVRHSQPSSAPRLFDSDEDDGEEKDTERFEIRPEFEGEAGLKLMALQSRFGTDERFKMDTRFLDDRDDAEKQTEKQTEEQVEEESLQTEKQKNLHILQNLLGTSAAPPERAKAKTFRDVSALHYDPSKQEHAAYEKNTEEQKESKGSRRKKREEAQKLPEVSKEIYFEVHADLKAVFGKDLEPQQNQDQEKEPGRGSGWDQEDEDEEEEEEEEEEQAEDKETEETGGFKFSFFGDDPELEPQQQTEYAVESIPAPKLSWQQDPRLNDSSDEEEEEEGEEGGDAEEAAGDAAAEETPPTSELFFFFPSDRRLMDSAQWFCRTSLDEQRDEWEETRTALRQDCKKKHKDARRKLRGSVQR